MRVVADREPQFGRQLSELTLPTLILWGAHDPVTLPHNAMTFDEMIPDSRLVIFDDVGHLTMEEAPSRTAALIDEFLIDILSDSPDKLMRAR